MKIIKQVRWNKKLFKFKDQTFFDSSNFKLNIIPTLNSLNKYKYIFVLQLFTINSYLLLNGAMMLPRLDHLPLDQNQGYHWEAVF